MQPKSQVDGGGVPDWSQMEVIPKSSSYHVPYFILSVSIAELVAFLYEVVRLKNDSCIDVDAAGPPPLCSPLIYNPYREIEMFLAIRRSKWVQNCSNSSLLDAVGYWNIM